MDKPSAQLQRLVDDVEKLLRENDLAIPNPYVPKRIRFLATMMRPLNGYAGRKCDDIAYKADIFYSDRKHKNYQGGADALYAEMTFSLLGILKSQVQLLQETEGGA